MPSSASRLRQSPVGGLSPVLLNSLCSLDSSSLLHCCSSSFQEIFGVNKQEVCEALPSSCASVTSYVAGVKQPRGA